MGIARIAGFALCAGLAIVATPARLDAAGRKTYEDKARGFRLMIGEDWSQVPPKLSKATAFIVGNWYLDAAKYENSLQPELQVYWFVKPNAAPVTPSGGDKAVPPPKAMEDPDGGAPTSTEEAVDKLTERNPHLFGKFVATAERLREAEKTKAHGNIEARYLEINPKQQKVKKGEALPGYAFVAKLQLTHADETIEVGFLGLCAQEHSKKLAPLFLDVVQSFEELKQATDSRNLGAQSELDPEDPENFRRLVRQTKLIKGWAAYDTPHYMVLYPPKGIDPTLAKQIGERLESLRSQVYEVLFPPDRPIKAISVVRCCADVDEYHAYGGPPSTGGYWYPPGMELVFFEMDKGKREDALRVLYHEGFHQYIHYSVGDFAPHSWFNEGHGDYFFGFNYSTVNSKWVRDTNSWRMALAKAAKKQHKFPALWDWLHWSQAEYYGNNKSEVSIGENYALGWDFVYFLRTTKKKEYQGILDRYFLRLKGCVTRARAAREAAEKAAKAASDPADPNAKPPAVPDPAAAATTDPGNGVSEPIGTPEQWLNRALDAAFKGVDMKQLEKDWLDD